MATDIRSGILIRINEDLSRLSYELYQLLIQCKEIDSEDEELSLEIKMLDDLSGRLKLYTNIISTINYPQSIERLDYLTDDIPRVLSLLEKIKDNVLNLIPGELSERILRLCYELKEVLVTLDHATMVCVYAPPSMMEDASKIQ